MTARNPLDVWLYGTRAATITDHGREIRLRWSQDAYERWGQGGRVVSHLLPIDRPSEQPHHLRVRAFLAGLLPEGNIRERYAHAAGVTSDDIFGMIRAYGKETAGALIFVEEGTPEPDRIGSLEPVSDDQISVMLADAAGVGPVLATPNDHHLQSTSLAGIQPKIVLSRTSDGWARCLDGYPSTHIAKLAHPPDSYAKDVVHTEVASLDLARALGLTTIKAELINFGNSWDSLPSSSRAMTGSPTRRGALNESIRRTVPRRSESIQMTPTANSNIPVACHHSRSSRTYYAPVAPSLTSCLPSPHSTSQSATLTLTQRISPLSGIPTVMCLLLPPMTSLCICITLQPTEHLR